MADEEPDLDEPWRLSPKLKWELEMALSGQIETSQELGHALDYLLSSPVCFPKEVKGDPKLEKNYKKQMMERRRLAVPLMWKWIADDKANIAEKDIWVTAVAKLIVDTVLPAEATKRPSAALYALGYRGHLEKYADLREEMDMYDVFKRPTDEELSRREFALRMQRQGHLSDKTVDEAMKIIDRLRET